MTDQSGPAPNTEHQRTQALEQITLISRVLEGFESAPKAIIHDYTVNSGTATLSYSIPGDVTVWKITLQTYKAARLAETLGISRDEQHAIELAEPQAAAAGGSAPTGSAPAGSAATAASGHAPSTATSDSRRRTRRARDSALARGHALCAFLPQSPPFIKRNVIIPGHRVQGATPTGATTLHSVVGTRAAGHLR
jgi:hypothetical protein